MCAGAPPADELTHAARSFGAVVARDPFDVDEPRGLTLLEWYRVLRPGGAAVCVTTGRQPSRPGEWLSCAGFVHVQVEDDVLTRRLDAPYELPWYRRLAQGRVPVRFAWGRRP